MLIRVGFALALFALAGCASAPSTRWLEAGHAALILADTSQTLQGQNAPDCYSEVGSPARDLIGAHPSDSKIVGYGAVHIAVHAMVSGWLDRKIEADDDDGWRWIRVGWHIITFATEISTVRDNHREGLGVFSPGAVPKRCIDARASANELVKR